MEIWHEPDGKIAFCNCKNILTKKDMLNTSSESPLGKFIDQLQTWGYNGLNFRGNFRLYPDTIRAFAAYLKSKGIGLILGRNWHELESRHSWPSERRDKLEPWESKKVCPYSKATKTHWKRCFYEDYQLIPDIAGYCVNATEFYFNNGAPWQCPCDECKKHTSRERCRDAIRLMADLLSMYDATLFWETCQDDPGGQKIEAEYWDKLTGEIPENAFILIKDYYWDYHPAWPRHPLFDTITKDKNGLSPYMTSIQLAGEYRGIHKIPWCMVDEWSKVFRDMERTGQQGIWVMATGVEPETWDHPLNLVNWYCIPRFCQDPQLDPDKIKLEWAEKTFSKEVALIVLDVVKLATDAARGILEFDGLWTQNHSYFPNLAYLDSHLCGPCRQSPRMKGMIGLELPLDMYNPERVAEIKTDPATRMVFNRVAITPKLKNQILAQKDYAIISMKKAVKLWESLKGKIDTKTYNKVLISLTGNINDAIIWRRAMELYMDFKLGTLTEEQVDHTVESFREIKGTICQEPLNSNPGTLGDYLVLATLASFGDELKQELRTPKMEELFEKYPESQDA